MRYRWGKLFTFAALAVLLCLCPEKAVCAQETNESTEPPPEEPFAVVAVASVERMLSALDFSFEVSDRIAASEAIGGYLEKAGDLKGLNRRQGLGVMIYLSGITPQPIGFAPVENIDDLMKTVELGPFTTKKVTG